MCQIATRKLWGQDLLCLASRGEVTLQEAFSCWKDSPRIKLGCLCCRQTQMFLKLGLHGLRKQEEDCGFCILYASIQWHKEYTWLLLYYTISSLCPRMCANMDAGGPSVVGTIALKSTRWHIYYQLADFCQQKSSVGIFMLHWLTDVWKVSALMQSSR